MVSEVIQTEECVTSLEVEAKTTEVTVTESLAGEGVGGEN
jgi:hypothetical protein